jgi:hypothetical protein
MQVIFSNWRILTIVPLVKNFEIKIFNAYKLLKDLSFLGLVSLETTEPSYPLVYADYDNLDSYGNYDDPENKNAGCSGSVFSHSDCELSSFPTETLKSLYPNLKHEQFCCAGHTYIATDDCKVSIFI